MLPPFTKTFEPIVQKTFNNVHGTEGKILVSTYSLFRSTIHKIAITFEPIMPQEPAIHLHTLKSYKVSKLQIYKFTKLQSFFIIYKVQRLQ